MSEWAVDEVAVALSTTGGAAGRLLAESLSLVDRLPATLAALEDGRLSWRHAQVMTDLVAPLADDLRTVAEERLLSRLADKTPPQLRAAARRVVQRLDAEAITRRVAEALRSRRVAVHPTGDGLGSMTVSDLPLPVLRAVEDALRQYADAAAAPGDERTRTQRMADCLVDLVLRPGEHGLAPVQARLTVVASIRTLLGDDEPGEVDGDLVPAEAVRELAYALGLLPRPHRPVTGDDSPAAPTGVTDRPATEDDPAADPAADLAAAPTADQTVDARRDGAAGTADGAADPAGDDPADPAADDRDGDAGPPGDLPTDSGLAALLGIRSVGGTALPSRPEIALVDELSGQLLALTDAAGLRAGRALGPPPESPGYRPAAALDRFVRRRDRRCRFPGCRARARRDDLDHTGPWPAGPTDRRNLAALCRHHHRLRHQAPGWRLRGLADGGLQWTTPTGQVLVTHPPRHGTDDDLPPPARSAPPGDDPPPF